MRWGLEAVLPDARIDSQISALAWGREGGSFTAFD